MYTKFSDYLKLKYGQKVYKLPINLPSTCPNRDGTIGNSGCIFCGEEGAGFECLSSDFSVKKQLELNRSYIEKNYNPKKFIAYFQNYSNTYFSLDKFQKYMEDACVEDVVALYISTRPDLINDKYLEILKNIKEQKKVDIIIELGLQSINIHTLKFINRGHGLAEFIDAVLRIHKFDLEICVHMILDIPNDNIDDVIEGAKILSSLGVEQVKCHSLFILRDTELGRLYEKGNFKPISFDDFIERTITFLEYLNPSIVVQRLLGRAPEDRSLFCNFGMSWWKIKDIIDVKMTEENRYQGSKFNYLNGALIKQKNFND